MPMKHMRRILGVMLSFWLFAGIPAEGMAASAGEGKIMTVMVYMCGSNLESRSGAATMDLLEMAQSGYDAKKINLLVMTGGTQAWQMGLPTDALSIYIPFRNTLRMVYAFKSMSMGSPEALGALLAFGAEKYPADEYSLILWNHGGGPMNGICWDELYDSDHLTMEELCTALRGSPFAEKGLTWIGFDACLMASAETAFLMEPFAEYMIASEETEPAGGWDYSFLNGLEQDPDVPSTARRIIDGYFGTGNMEENLTMSVIDLSRIRFLVEAMDAFFGEVEVSGGNYAWLSYAARNTRSFGRAVSAGESYDLMDLGGLIDGLEEQAPELADQVRDALSKAVAYHRDSYVKSSGLSVYHPFFNKREYAASWAALYPRIGFSQGYSGYINRFSEYLFGTARNLDWGGLRTARTEQADVYALPLTESQREMLSSLEMHVLRWNEKENAYLSIASETRQEEKDGVIYARDPEQILVAADGDGNLLSGALPYEILPDGRLAVYVNYCTREAAGREEACMLPVFSGIPGRKNYGSSSYGEDEIKKDSLKVSSAPIMQMSPMDPDLKEAIPVPDTFSLNPTYSPSGGGTGIYSPTGTVPIEPASILTDAMPQPDGMILRQTGTGIPLDAYTSVEVSTFRIEQVNVDLTQYKPGEFRPAEPEEILHSQWVLEMDDNGELQLLEIRMYEPLNGEWTPRITAPLEDYPVLAFPAEWRKPILSGDTLAPFDSWTVVRREAARISDQTPILRFVPDNRVESCVIFEVTDIQCTAHCSLPVMIRSGNE
jgi:hypothetical protein